MVWGFTAVLIGTLAGWIITSLLAIRELDRLRRAADRAQITWTQERRDLLDRLMYLSGKPWEMPPVSPESEDEEESWQPDVMDNPIETPEGLVYELPIFPPVNRV